VYASSTALGEFGLYDGNGGSLATDVTNGYWSGEAYGSSAISQGTDTTDRIGNVIKVKELEVRVRIFNQAEAGLQRNRTVKAWLVRAKIPLPSSSFNVSQIWLEDTAFKTITANSTKTNWYALTPQSYRNPYYMHMYEVVAEGEAHFHGEYSASWDQEQHDIVLRTRKPFVQRFDPGGAFSDTAVRLILVASDGNVGGAVTSAAIVTGALTTAASTGFYHMVATRMVFEDA